MAAAPSPRQVKGADYWNSRSGLRCHLSKRIFYNAIPFEHTDVGVIICVGNPYVASSFRFSVEKKGNMPVNNVNYYVIIFSDYIIDNYYNNEVQSIKKACESKSKQCVEKTKSKKSAIKSNDRSYSGYTNYNNHNNHNDNNNNNNMSYTTDPLGLYKGEFISSAKPTDIRRRHNVDNNDTVVFDTEDEDEMESDVEEPPRKRRRKTKASSSYYRWNDTTSNDLILATKDTQFWTSRSDNCCRDQVMPNLIERIGKQPGLTHQKAYRKYVLFQCKFLVILLHNTIKTDHRNYPFDKHFRLFDIFFGLYTTVCQTQID